MIYDFDYLVLFHKSVRRSGLRTGHSSVFSACFCKRCQCSKGWILSSQTQHQLIKERKKSHIDTMEKIIALQF